MPINDFGTRTCFRSVNLFIPPSDLPEISTSSHLLTSTTPMIHPFVGHTQSGGGAGGGGHHMADVLLSLKNPIVHPEDPATWSGIHISQGIASPVQGSGTTLEPNHPRSACPGESNNYNLERQVGIGFVVFIHLCSRSELDKGLTDLNTVKHI